MAKVYSNKALPAGTVLREWRLEEVLGVGGFGIVYKGRGIYFNELVAIKEYFPSSISERDEEDTVVAIDSNAEEVHALGLKKFVEEAKLLWNLSTPSRHPNIVNVRSLFEIHGTAYMVMDFEDGMSLSRLLKNGRRFNERSLLDLVRPIAEGLDRAHRVGVLHRDIKPANILINQDNRPVLIDFGSARFEAAEATSTTVTFHTPPYAAIEQYVKTYEQGPWTDIYALGVVLHECVTGSKPPEVLERLHGGLGESLVGGSWPGYSNRFLAAVDAAMTIRPGDRPRSISDWLPMFGGAETTDKSSVAVEVDDEATRIVTYSTETDHITAIAPGTPGFSAEAIETGVPADPKQAKFKLAGEDTSAKKVVAPPAAAAADALADDEDNSRVADPRPKEAAASSRAPKPEANKRRKSETPDKRILKSALAGVAAFAVLGALGGAWALSGDSDADVQQNSDSNVGSTSVSETNAEIDEAAQLGPGLRSLADDAKAAGVTETAFAGLTQASTSLTALNEDLQRLLGDPANASLMQTRMTEMRRVATSASGEFANALARDAEGRSRRLGSAAPALQSTLTNLRSAAEKTGAATDPQQSIAGARQVLTLYSAFTAAAANASAKSAAERAEREVAAVAAKASSTAPKAAKSAVATEARGTTAKATGPASAAKLSQLRGIIENGRSMAKQVVRLGKKKPGSSATTREKQGYEIRRNNAATASGYEKYFAEQARSLKGPKTQAEVDELITEASRTAAYSKFLLMQSNNTKDWK